MKLYLLTALGLLSVFGAPSISVKADTKAADKVLVVAYDADGLDSLEVSSPQSDLTYQTQLSRSSVDRRFERSFALSELFPSVKEWKKPVLIKVTVRSTKGATATATTSVP